MLVVFCVVVGWFINLDVKWFVEKMIVIYFEVYVEVEMLVVCKVVCWLGEKIKVVEKWVDKDVDDFDEDYVEVMIDEYKKLVWLFEKVVCSVDVDIVVFVVKILLVL